MSIRLDVNRTGLGRIGLCVHGLGWECGRLSHAMLYIYRLAEYSICLEMRNEFHEPDSTSIA